jgi:hypothetical protein
MAKFAGRGTEAGSGKAESGRGKVLGRAHRAEGIAQRQRKKDKGQKTEVGRRNAEVERRKN